VSRSRSRSVRCVVMRQHVFDCTAARIEPVPEPLHSGLAGADFGIYICSGACVRCRRMSVLSLLLNIAWIVCGGLWMALGWIVAAVIMVVTIIGIPWAKAAFNIAVYTRMRRHCTTLGDIDRLAGAHA